MTMGIYINSFAGNKVHVSFPILSIKKVSEVKEFHKRAREKKSCRVKINEKNKLYIKKNKYIQPSD